MKSSYELVGLSRVCSSKMTESLSLPVEKLFALFWMFSDSLLFSVSGDSNTDERQMITPDDRMTDKWIYERICMDEINDANAHTQFEFYLTQQAQFDD